MNAPHSSARHPRSGRRDGRVRWAAVGAAVAVTLGSGGLLTASAASGSGERDVFVPIAPCRLLDTRPAGDNVGTRSSPLAPGETFIATVRGTNGNCTIPTDAVGVSMNVDIVNPSAASFLTVFPADAARPLAANLNWTASQAPTPNAVTARLSADGRLAFYNLAGTVDVSADINGYYLDHNHDDRYYTRAQLESGPNNIGLLGRMSKQELALGEWWQDPARNASIAVGSQVAGLAFDGAHIWASLIGSNSVVEIDPVTGQVLHTVTGIGGPLGIAFDGTSLWVASSTTSKLFRIDAATATITGNLAAGTGVHAVVFDGTAIWASVTDAPGVIRVDPATMTKGPVVATGQGPENMTFDGRYLWVANHISDTLSKIDTTNSTSLVVASMLNGAPTGIVFDGSQIWELESGSNALRGIDATTNGYTSDNTPIAGGAGGLSFDGHRIWAATASSLTAVDRTVNSVASRFYGQLTAQSPILFDGSSLWVGGSGSLFKLTP